MTALGLITSSFLILSSSKRDSLLLRAFLFVIKLSQAPCRSSVLILALFAWMRKKVLNKKKLFSHQSSKKVWWRQFFTLSGPLLIDEAVVVPDFGDDAATLFHRVRGSVTLVPKSWTVQWKILVTSQILHFTEQQSYQASLPKSSFKWGTL